MKENLKSNKNSLKVGSWNISKGLLRKLADKEFLHEVVDSDIVCFNECWVKCPKEFELDGYCTNMCIGKSVMGAVLLCFIKSG